MMEKLGMKPYTVDVQPLAIANAFNRTQESIALGLAYVVIHISSGVANLIICGDESVPFFHRSIYFAFDDLFSDAQNSEALAPENCEKTFRDLTDEIGRSIGFYEKTYSIKNFAGVFLLGDYVNDESIINAIGMKTKLPTEVIDIFGRLKQASKAPHGKFEVAVSLAMRNA
jgi:Tfp pilus assembly PilM family ATPase